MTVSENGEKYHALSEAIRNSFLPPKHCRVIGAAIWQAQDDKGLVQVGGNVGKGQSYPLSLTEGSEKLPSVVDAFMTSKWTFFQRTEVSEVYILCYPLGKKYVLSPLRSKYT